MTIDLRSDTVTKPSKGMREAMANADVGDDVYGDDPTVNRLQSVLAEQGGFEAGLFFASGTQCNLAALMTHCQRGDEYLVGNSAHTYKYEGGGAAVLGSIQPQPIENEADGSISLRRIAQSIKPVDDHFARTRLLTLENTMGGKVLPQPYVAEATAFAKSKGLRTHLDGARLFNAAVTAGLSLETMCRGFDSVSICLSKGLGAPAGSVLLGTKAFLKEAHRWRKMLGGGLRQAGILAAAGLYALEHNVNRLADDHANAAHLASSLRGIEGLTVEAPQTNMVWCEVTPALQPKLAAAFEKNQILASMGSTLRLVTHLDVSRAQVDAVIEVIRKAS